MQYSADPVVNAFAYLGLAIFLYSVWFNPRCAFAILIGIVAAWFVNNYGDKPLHMLAMIAGGALTIVTFKGFKLTLLEVESNEVNYIIFALLAARVGFLTLYLIGLAILGPAIGLLILGEAFFVLSYIFLFIELIILSWSVHYGIPESLTNNIRRVCGALRHPHLAKT